MANPTNTRKATAHLAPFGVRMQPELKSRLEAAAESSGRSMNAEIVARLEASLDGKDPDALPEIRISLDAGNEPISWDEIHEYMAAIRKKMSINDVNLYVTVKAARHVPSEQREDETAALAKKLRKIPALRPAPGITLPDDPAGDPSHTLRSAKAGRNQKT